MDSIDLSPRKVKCVISNGRIKKKIGRVTRCFHAALAVGDSVC